jgi:hypothetical protein
MSNPERLEAVLAAICALMAPNAQPDAFEFYPPLLAFLCEFMALPRPTYENARRMLARPDFSAHGAVVLNGSGNKLKISGNQWAGLRLPCSALHDTYRTLFGYLYSISWNGQLPHKFPYSATFVNEPPPINCAAFAAALEPPAADAITRHKIEHVLRLWGVYKTSPAELALLCPPVEAIWLLWRELHAATPDAPSKFDTLMADPRTAGSVLPAVLAAVLYLRGGPPRIFDHVVRPVALESARAANTRNRAVGLLGCVGLGRGINVLPYLHEHYAVRAVSTEIANAVARQPPWYSLMAVVDPMCASPDMRTQLIARLLRALIRQ